MDIPTLSPGQARERQQHGAILVDIRQPHERAAGQAEGALAIDRAELEADPGRHLPDMDAEVLLVCQLGRRSLDAARVLRAAGYARVRSVEGGTEGWIRQGLPVVRPDLDADQADFLERYSRRL